MPLPPVPQPILRPPLRIPPGERWCTSCGLDVPANYRDDASDVSDSKRCPHCHQAALVDAISVLREGEYYISS